MEYPDLAQMAAVGGALGAPLVLLARGRVALLAGLVVLGVSELLLAYSLGTGSLDRLTGATGLAAALVGMLAVGAAAAVLARRPMLVPIAVLVAAPFRPPLSFDSGGSFLVSIADDGRLGRLLPLYFVLAAAGAALAWRALRGRELRPLPAAIALPAAVFFAFACLSLLWAEDLEAGTNLLVFFTLPFALLLATVARADFPDAVPKALAVTALVLASLFAVVGLWQAGTRELFFYAPNLAVSNANTDFFRVTSLFGDPSLYGRHLVLGIGVALSLLAARRWKPVPLVGVLALLWTGLFFSYSQSSMAALLVVILAIALVTGDRRIRMAVGVARRGRGSRGRGVHGGPARRRQVDQPHHERPHRARGGHHAGDRGAPAHRGGDRRPAAREPRAGAQRPALAQLRLAHHAAHRVRRAGDRGARALRLVARRRRPHAALGLPP